MLTRSEEYRSAILPGADKVRRTDVRVTIKLPQTTATKTASATGEAAWSDVSQIVNEVFDPEAAIATCEPDRWNLGGSCVFGTPDEVGFISDELSDVNGDFNTFWSVGVELESMTSNLKYITIMFDRLHNEYAVDFILTFDFGGGMTEYITVTDNNSPYVKIDVPSSAASILGVRIKPLKWSKPYHRAKISEIYVGLIQQWGHRANTNMLSNSTIQETDFTMRTAPFGTSTAIVYNENNEFDALNPTGLAAALTDGAEMIVEHGVYVHGVIEYVKTGTYRFDEWKNTGNNKIELTGLDTLGFYGQEIVRSRNSWSSYADGNPVVFLENFIWYTTDLPVSLIDLSALENNSVDGFRYAPVNYKFLTLLRKVAQFSKKILVTDADGVIKFRSIGIDVVSTDVIDPADVYGDYDISVNRIPKYIHVNYYTAKPSDTVEEISYTEQIIDGYTELKIWIGYDYVYDSVGINGAINSWHFVDYSYGYVEIHVDGIGAPVGIQINGKKWEVVKSTVTVTNPYIVTDKNTSITIDNEFIGTREKAIEIGTWIQNVISYENVFKFNWRGNPTIELGDINNIEINDTPLLIQPYKQTFSYDGTLSSEIEGVRASLG